MWTWTRSQSSWRVTQELTLPMCAGQSSLGSSSKKIRIIVGIWVINVNEFAGSSCISINSLLKMLLCDAAGMPLWWPWGEESRASHQRRFATYPGMKCTCPPPWRTLSQLWRKCLNPYLQLIWKSMKSGLKSLGPVEKHQQPCVWHCNSS